MIGNEGNSSCSEDDDDEELPPPPLPPKSEGVAEPRRTVRVLPPKRGHGQAPPELPPKKQGTAEPKQHLAPDLPPRSNPVLHWPPPPPDSEDGSSDGESDPDDPPQLPPKPNSGSRISRAAVGFEEEKKGDSSQSDDDDFREKSEEEKRRRFQARREVGKSVKDLTMNYDAIANTSQLKLADHSVTQQKQKLLAVPGSQPRVRRKSASSREDADTYIQLSPKQKQEPYSIAILLPDFLHKIAFEILF